MNAYIIQFTKSISKMDKKRSTISITAGIGVVLLLIGGTGATTILITTVHAQTAPLGEPFKFVEKGTLTGQKEIGPNRTQFTFTSNGTLNGNIEVTDAGEFVSISKGNNLTYDQGQGVIATKDGSETANYTFIEVGNGTAYQGASAYSTNSTGKLSFLNNILGIFKSETDESGNFVGTEWQWK
jgi:aldehyde:ferredoxin oxidoreductase